MSCSPSSWPGPRARLGLEQVTFDINDSFTDEFLSDHCGFEVVFSISGHLNATVRYNDAGLVVSEIDRQPNTTITYSSPDTGRSFSFPNAQPSHWDYGAGATLGSAVTIKLTGLFGHVPGVIASDAGQTVLIGVVDGFSPEGVPFVNFTDQSGQAWQSRGRRSRGRHLRSTHRLLNFA